MLGDILDIAAAVIAFASPVLASYWGYRLTVHPIGMGEKENARKRRYGRGFLFCGLIGALAVGITAYRNTGIGKMISEINNRPSNVTNIYPPAPSTQTEPTKLKPPQETTDKAYISDHDLCAELPGLVESLARKGQAYQSDYMQFSSVPVGSEQEQAKQMNERNDRKLHAEMDFVKYNRELLNRGDYLRGELELKMGQVIPGVRFRDEMDQQEFYPNPFLNTVENMRAAASTYCSTHH